MFYRDTGSFSNPVGEIYVINADGIGQTRLTNNATGDFYPRWQYGTVPEPGLALLLMSGMGLLVGLKLRKKSGRADRLGPAFGWPRVKTNSEEALLRLLLIILFLTLGAPAFASDGVAEINQACATSAGGCFAGDAIGFPVTISQSGAYRLTGNLSLPANTTAIDILANGVVLDLGGFAIVGPNVCNNLPVNSCTTAFGASGIRATQPGQFGVTVRNGSVMGMGGVGVHMEAFDQSVYSMVVEDLVVAGNGSTGIALGGLSRVMRCRVHRNLGTAITLQVQGSAEKNDAYANGVSGLFMQGGQAVRNHIRFNGSTGIALDPSTVTLLRENSLSANLGANDLRPGSSSTGDNLCNGVRC